MATVRLPTRSVHESVATTAARGATTSICARAVLDIGYTRSVQRADGKIVTIYYWVGDPKKERTIEATIWDPDKAGK